MRSKRVCLAALVTALGLTAIGAAQATEPVHNNDHRGFATAEGARDRAEATLSAVEAAMSGRHARTSHTAEKSPDLTMLLRDLKRDQAALAPADRVEAERFFARPTDGEADPLGDGYTTAEATPVCGVKVCVHYVTTEGNDDAVPAEDILPVGLPNGIPDYVDLALDTLEGVNDSYVAAGYRAPKSDEGSDGSDLVDVYLVDVGDKGYYGYCTSDQPAAQGVYDVWAYCVLDNNYTEYPRTPIQNLQVTAAHEYFHAVQFGYDYLEDRWLMEATATWAEDELFDAVNDNRQYLTTSPIRQPWIPMDRFHDDGRQYGDWIFFRYLTERYPTKIGPLPSLVLDIWNRLDAAPGEPDQYSLQAVRNTLAARGANFARVFSSFADGNRRPAKTYSEGAAYPRSPLAGPVLTLSPAHKSTGWLQVTRSHLTSATAQFKPGSTLTARDWRVRVNIDMPPPTRGSAATVSVYLKSGKVVTSPVSLSSTGNAVKTLNFSRQTVKYVELTLTNASGRYNCWVPPYDSPYSCLGYSLDDGLRSLFRATAFRS